jgi:hypothetical protein
MARLGAAHSLAVLATLIAAGCASRSPSPEVKAAKEGGGVVVGESVFMRTGPMEGSDATPCEAPSRSAQPPEVLTPDSHWIGTVGLTTSLSDSLRCGLGIEVPNPSDRRAATIPIFDRLRETGVGAWVSWDF